ncbi:MAG: hypothetical protein M3N13_04775, partial [Candidatus Eremiobacteraeota bacterium]|nr:hypothetical protein [Candidatus Eremiobacteraeota bacterium]
VGPRDRGGSPRVYRTRPTRTEIGAEQRLIELAVDAEGCPSHAMPLRQDARIALGPPGGFSDRVRVASDEGAYVYALAGVVSVGDEILRDGDVAMIAGPFDAPIAGDPHAHAIVAIVPLSSETTGVRADVSAIVGSDR